jgi:hypothetical protein
MARAKTRTANDFAVFQAAIRYEPMTGKLSWAADGSEIVVGTMGRVTIRGHRDRPTGARIAWALGHGKWPPGNVYAANNDETDLRLSNLRLRDESRYGEDGRISAKTRHGYGLVQRYGIRQAEYDAMFAAQGGVCACCGRPETQRGRTGKIKTLHVDHDHKTREVRALLCAHCNWMIGLADDDPDFLRLGIEYLARHRRAKLTVITSKE